MGKLIIVSGPSGVGKNTLVDAIVENYPNIKYFKKITTRDKRPDDRAAEVSFVSSEEYKQLMSQHRIALPYEIRGKQYGLPVDSFADLKNGTRIACLGEFQLIKSLREAFDTTTVYVTAPIETITNRLLARTDTDEQRQKSVEAVPKHLEMYEKYKELFDYEIKNTDNLQAAQKELLAIVHAETLVHTRAYSFLLPRSGSSLGWAQAELDAERSGFKSLPEFREITKKLEENMNAFYFGSGILPIARTYIHGDVNVAFYSSRDKERDHISFGSFELRGSKKDIEKTGALLRELFPELKSYEQKEKKMATDDF